MTPSTEARTEEPADRTSGDWPGVGRRPLLKALSAGAALSVGSGIATARSDDDHGASDDRGRTVQSKGFSPEVVVPHATFPDDVAAAIGVTYEDGAEDSAFLHDASSVVIVRARIAPGGASGWHSDNGPALLTVVDGDVNVTFGDGCVTRSYAAGEATVVTGRHADHIENASDTQPAMVYVIFLGVPDGEPPSSPVEAPDC